MKITYHLHIYPQFIYESFHIHYIIMLYIFQVTEIDDGLLQLKNLKQLTLSANLIKNIESKRLPKGLEVGFRFTTINILCDIPRGFNKIRSRQLV